ENAAKLAKEKARRRPATIVFEGNVPADPSDNRVLADKMGASAFGSSTAATQLWLGDAIAIKDPTAATIRRQAGGNLLVVGQQDVGATALVAMAILSAAMQRAPADARFVILDGT